MKKFKVRKETPLFQWKNRFSMYRVDLELPNKRQAQFILRKSNPYAIIIPRLNANSFVMVWEYRLGADAVALQFPMGQVAGKDPETIAKQELLEETGYYAGKLTCMGSFYIAPGWSTQKGFIFLAENLQKGKQNLEPYECIEVVEMPISSIDGAIQKGVIFDASTILAFYQYQRLFGK